MEYDYIIIGAGPAGTTVASRLSSRDSSLRILLIEAGPDPSTSELAETVKEPMQTMLLKGTEFDWDYEGVPQKRLDGAKIYVGAGRGLGGGTIINYGVWTRGDAKDYDEWARLVGDERWSWKGFLPYFRRTETHHDPNQSSELHGHEGHVTTATTTSQGRDYPLREPLRKAWTNMGVNQVQNINGGSPLGIAEILEARKDGKRVVAAEAYPLDKVQVMSNTLVKRIVVSSLGDGKKIATGVELADGQQIVARREVVISAGAIRTPQLLILSGIGCKEELDRHGIAQVVESPNVGKGLWDHACLLQTWKLRNPEIGAALGHPKFNGTSYSKGLPFDFYTTACVPRDEMIVALSKDGAESAEAAALVNSPRCHLGFFVFYAGEPLDGSYITTWTLNLLPTSRGTVKISSTDPHASPLVDHNFIDTEADRYRIMNAVRTTTKLMSTSAMQEMVLGEAVPEGYRSIADDPSDENIHKLFSAKVCTLQHPAGTAAMGKVVDTRLKVMGIEGLRVVDASVLPTPISCPLQACMYALGEQAADMMLGEPSSGFVPLQ